jgi:hypothetical protein
MCLYMYVLYINIDILILYMKYLKSFDIRNMLQVQES